MITPIYSGFCCFQSLSSVQHFVNPWTAAHWASLSFTISHSLFKLMSMELVMPLVLSTAVPFSSCLQSLPASGYFLMSQVFTSGNQSIGPPPSASIVQWKFRADFPLGFTGLMPLHSKGVSRVFSNTTVQKHKLFRAQCFLSSDSHIHTWLLGNP